MEKSSFKLPHICGNCGERNAETVWNMPVKVQNLSAWSAITIFAGVAVTNTKTYAIPVAVCEICHHNLTQKQKWRSRINAGGIMAILLALVFLVVQAGIPRLGQIVAPEVLGVLFLVTLAGWWIAAMALRINLGTFNGRYFKFNKKAYQAEFAELNPDLVRQNKRKT